MTHKELRDEIDRVSRMEEMKKQSLESDFSEFKKRMMPAAIAKRALNNSIYKIKSLLPNFLHKSKPSHG
jgi:hypothetical protein